MAASGRAVVVAARRRRGWLRFSPARIADDSADRFDARTEASPTQLAYLDESPATSPATTNPAPGTPAPRTPGAPAAQPQTPKPKIGGGVWGPALQLFNELLSRSRPENQSRSNSISGPENIPGMKMIKRNSISRP